MYAITFAAAAILWPYIVGLVASKYGPDVSARFLERPGNIPSNGKALTRASLEEWIRSPETGRYRASYGFLIMGLDLVYVVLATVFLWRGSLWLAEALSWPGELPMVPSVLVCLLPGIYGLSDFVEDILIMYILRHDDVGHGVYTAMRAATGIKLVSFSAALLQVIALGLVALYVTPPSG